MLPRVVKGRRNIFMVVNSVDACTRAYVSADEIQEVSHKIRKKRCYVHSHLCNDSSELYRQKKSPKINSWIGSLKKCSSICDFLGIIDFRDCYKNRKEAISFRQA